MRIEVRARQSGKTNDMLLRAHGTKNLIVCMGLAEVQRLKALILDLEVDVLTPITYGMLCERQFPAEEVEGIYIDNAELILQSMSRHPIKLITMSNSPSTNLP